MIITTITMHLFHTSNFKVENFHIITIIERILHVFNIYQKLLTKLSHCM